MKIRNLICILLFAAIGLNGCIEIIEEITVHPDGSGSINMSVDIGALGSAANGNSGQFDMSMLDRIKKIPADAPGKLEQIKGISNIKAVSDDKKGLYSVAFDFADSRVLNKAIYKMAGFKKTPVSPSFIKITKHKLVKKDLSPFLRKAMKDQQKKSYNEFFFSFISYTTTCHFPADVKKASNIKSERPNARSVSTKFTLDEMLKGGSNFGNVIRY
jgi:hypothetical protein